METICAISSAVGGAISVLRISGDNAFRICEKCWQGSKPLSKLPARKLMLGRLINTQGTIDSSCLAVKFPGPDSYTGEDVVEFHCHGGALCARLALDALLQNGALPAQPGEFTKRAFLNGKLDLTQAEAVQEIITAGSENAINLASRQLQGNLGRVVNSIYDTIHTLLCEIESRLDFPEEELDFLPPEKLVEILNEAQHNLDTLAATRRCGEILRGGISLVIAGAPNVGKSSLLNLMLGRDRAIVSDIPGTTRDTIDAQISICGIPIHLVDTAGIHHSDDFVEKTGMKRSRQSAESADIVIWMTDTTNNSSRDIADWKLRGNLIHVINKIDLQPNAAIPADAIGLSAATGDGIEKLYDAIEQAVWSSSAPEECEIAVSSRHALLLSNATAALKKCPQLLLSEQWELGALTLRDALEAIGQITGRTVTPDLLDAIFHKFCIGK